MAKYIKGNAIANATAYRVYRATRAFTSDETTEIAESRVYAEQTTDVSSGINILLDDITGLPSGTNYLTVQAVDSTGSYANSAYSNTIEWVVAESEDELAGTWVFNDTYFALYDHATYNVDFTCDGTTYSTIEFYYLGMGCDVYYDDTQVMSDASEHGYGRWVNEKYKTINITSTVAEVENGSSLLAVLKSHATKIITFTIDGTSYQAEEGMTWEEWVESDYNTNNFYLKEDINTLFTADDKEIFYDGNSIIGTYEIIANGVYTIAESEDELAGTWVFNSSPNISASQSWELLFTYGGFVDINYGIATKYTTSTQLIQYSDEYGDMQTAYNSTSGWVTDSLKTIHITSKLSEVTNGDTLLAWLQANATKQSSEEEATYSITYNLTGVTADGGNPSTIQSGDSATLRFTSTVGKNGNWEITATNATTSNFTDSAQWLSNGTTFGCDISNPTGDIIVTVLAASGPEAI